jgi:enoyl-CoA hydratase/carnithine racemase
MFTSIDEYRHKYKNIRFERRNGVLEVAFHTNGASLLWSAMPDGPQHTAGAAFYDVAHDPENRLVIITGTGERWCTEYDVRESPDPAAVTPLWWDHLFRAERDLITNLLNIPVPVIGVVNGPCSYHPEILLLSDVLLAADDAYFADDSHLAVNVVPGDGIQIIWEMLVGPNRARHLQYLHQRIEAKDALALGFVAELHPREALLQRARAVSQDLLARCSPMTLRATRATMTENLRRRIFSEHTGSYALEGLAQVMRPQLAHEPDVDVWSKAHPRAGSIKIGHD